MTNEQLVEQIKNGISVTDNMQALYEQNLPIIKKTIKPYSHNDCFEDLLQEVYFGLWEAVQHYETAENVKFMTYAIFWIRQAAIRYIENFNSVIRIPSATRQKILRYKKTVDSLSQNYGRTPTDMEVAKKMNVGLSELDNIKIYVCSTASLDMPLNSDTDDTLASTISADYDLERCTIDKIYDEYSQSELWGVVERYISPREYEVVKRRFINNETLQMIADSEEVTRQRIRDLEASALRKLRRGKARRELQEKFETVDCLMYRGGLTNFNEHDFTSTVEYVAIRRIELREQYEKRLREFEEIDKRQRKCV